MSVSVRELVACRMTLHGQVQGVGLRPALARLAVELQLSGTVANSSAGVVVQLEGTLGQIRMFQACLEEQGSFFRPLSVADEQFCQPAGHSGFRILESLADGPLMTRVPPDQATCATCLTEVSSDRDRRSGYEFTSCTDCGPRYSIIDAMPYDRCRTSMSRFELCRPCGDEYRSPDDRRFHSQTNACPTCGPVCQSAGNAESIDSAASSVLAGKILGLKGLGGYQLVVDATSREAIDRLRRRKQRPSRPLAVMVQTLAEAESLADLTDVEKAMLSSPTRPIALVKVNQGSSSSTLCHEAIHGGLQEIGLFLPTTPLHFLLLRHVGRPVVVTSGNQEGDPLALTHADAERDLSEVADVWLHHNREIVRPIDDSVVRVMAGRSVTVRNARGLAPLPLPALEHFARKRVAETGEPLPPVLAVGGHQKNAVALFNGHQAILGPHTGDLDSLMTRQRFCDYVENLQSLYRCEPRWIVHDVHPDYFSTRWAQTRAAATQSVQHHFAHVVSGLVQQDWLDREVLGVAFDGTGAGTDGTVWGGEFLQATIDGFRRVAHLRPFRIPGGEAAILEPWRLGVSLLTAAGESSSVDGFARRWKRSLHAGAVASLASSSHSVETTSAGRLFDGVASLILGLADSGFDGQPAMLLESAADTLVTTAYELPLDDSMQLDWRLTVRQILRDVREGKSPGVMATKFHRGLARGVASVCHRFDLPVVLTGGVFQNRLLTEWLLEELQSWHGEVACHSTIPPNDGGLAAGQLAIALAKLSRQQMES